MEFDTYDDFRHPELSWERIKDKIDWKDKIVMDVGCHNAWFLFAALDEGADEVIGIDLNKFHNATEQKEFMKPFDFIKKEIKTKSLDNSKIHLIEGDWLKAKTRQVDIVLCMNTAHYFSDIQGGIKKAFEHAKKYIIFETNEATKHKDFRLVSEIPSHWNNRVIKIYERKGINVSVIIPTYNAKPEYFKEAIESVINQTREPDEIIIIDDGSEPPIDIADEIWGRYEKKLIRTVYLRNEKNMGIGFSRQRGVDEATGDYVAFLSSDDVWDPKFLEVMIETANQQPNKILFSSNYHIDKEGKIIMKFEPPSYEDHEDFCIACWEAAYRNTMFVNFSCIFIPKKVFEKVWFDSHLRFCEDLDFLLRSMKDFEYYLVNQPLVYYRAADNLTSRIIDKIPEQNIKIRKKCREYWSELPPNKLSGFP